MTSENNYNTELIERYLSGTLDEDQRKEVEARLKSETDFHEEVRIQKEIRAASFVAGREQLRHRLKQIHREVEREFPTNEQTAERANATSGIRKFIDSNKYLLIAASITILIATTFITLNIDLRKNNQTIFQEYFEPYPNIASIQYRDDEIAQTDYEKAFAAYDEGNYKESIQIFKRLLDKEEDEITLFYLGSAYLASGDTENAVSTLKAYMEKYNELKPEATWYLGLANLKEGKEEEAKKIFKELSKDRNDFTDNALKILNEIN